MPTATFRTALPVDAATAFAWHHRPGALARLTPPWEELNILAATDRFADGTRWTFRSRLFGPFRMNWTIEHFGVIENNQFCYRLVKGPFRKWEHAIRFIPGGETCTLESEIDYSMPGLNRLMVPRINRLFQWRHTIVTEDLRRHAQFQNLPRMTIAITGSRGLIGSELVSFLTSGGHRVRRLISGRFGPPDYDDGTDWVAWQPQAPLPPDALNNVDAVIHLAGDSIARGRWTKFKKMKLRDSRVTPTRHLAAAVSRDRVPVFLSGSAVGFYGSRGDAELTEDTAVGSGFLADLCRDWEAAAQCGARVVNLRTGIVLSPKGGALAAQLPAFRLGGGAVLGGGEQFVSWIGIPDMVYAIHHLLMTPTISGPVNLVAPQPVSNRIFGRTLAKVMHRPYLLTVPPFALRLLFGELADEGMLASQRAVPAKLLAAGYTFMDDTLEGALRTLLP